MANIRLEAEYLNLTNYRLDGGGPDFDFISNTFAVGLPGGAANETGTISTNFGGATGTYDIIVGYFDEDDGAASYTFNIGGSVVDSWQATSTTGGPLPSTNSFATRTLSNQLVTNGALIELIGTENLNEPARVDYIEFVPTGNTPLPSLSGSNGTIEIMPLGDSVTKGTDAGVPDALFNGYRDNLQTLLANGGINSDLVGSRNHGSGFDTDHEGWGGFTITQIANNIDTWLTNAQPEIVLLTIGTNDLRSSLSTTVPDIVDKLSALIDKIIARVPYSRLVVSSVPPVNTNIPGNTTTFRDRVIAYNGLIPDLIAAKATAGKLISYVDAFGSIDAVQNISADGFHPNESGYTLAATAFYNEIQSLVGTISTTPTSGNDTLTGTSGDDTINGLRGDDIIQGLGGNDTLLGSAGNDTIDGGSGVNTIRGGPGNDIITGGNEGDTIRGDGGDDNITGGAGADNIRSGFGNDVVNAGAGNDIVNGENGNDNINGGDGNDTLDGVNGNDVINGGDGDDIVRGGDGSDTLRGGNGQDKVIGGNSNDFLFGDAGNDRLEASGGNDELVGGSGNDLLRAQAGDDILIGVDPTATDPGLGEVDKLIGNQGADVFVLGDENSVFYLGAGDSDFANIRDFKLSDNDIIQLSGSSSDYSLQVTGSNTRIFADDGLTTDLVGFVRGAQFSDFSAGFTFVP